MGTGYDGTNVLKDFWEYDPLNDTWTQIADFGGTARRGAVAFTLNGKAYVGTGSEQKDFWAYDPALDSWTPVEDFGGVGRSFAVAFTVNGKAYVGTGNDFYAPYLDDFWEYDPVADSWTQVADFSAGPRTDASAFTLNGKGYVGTGIYYDGYSFTYYYDDFYEYDPVADSWTQIASITGKRVGGVAFTMNGMGYVGAGYNNYGAYLKDFWEYDPVANSWTQFKDCGTTPRRDPVAFTLDGKAYVGTGYNNSDGYLMDIWKFHPDYNALQEQGIQNNGLVLDSKYAVVTPENWVQKLDLTGTSRLGAVAVAINDKVYVGTGYNSSSSYLKDFWEYDPVADSWTQRTDFGGTARRYSVAFMLNGKAYIGTGIDGAYRKDFWEYDPVADSWTQVADLGGSGRFGAVVFTLNGKAYVGLGNNGSANVTDFWAYDPGSNTWTQIADFTGSGRSYAVAFAANGKGYVGTGYDYGSYYQDFWEYDPVADSWTQVADYGGGPRTRAVGFSVNEKGYVGTGNNGSGNGRDFWEYDPVADSWNQVADYGGSGIRNGAACSLNGKAYMGTGTDGTAGSYLKDFWEYTPLSYEYHYNYVNTPIILPDENGFLGTVDYGTWTLDGASGYMYNSNGGRVGIGITEPTHILHIKSTGRSTSSSWATSSDARVKTQVKALGVESLEKILKLRPVHFQWQPSYLNYNPDYKPQMSGFIAQEVEEIFPEMVDRVEEQIGDQVIDDFRLLNLGELPAHIVRAIQEQQKQIELLQAMIMEKDKRIVDIETNLNQLQTRVDMLLEQYAQEGKQTE